MRITVYLTLQRQRQQVPFRTVTKLDQVRKDSGIVPLSCKHGQRVFHGDKLRQLVEALLHGGDCQ